MVKTDSRVRRAHKRNPSPPPFHPHTAAAAAAATARRFDFPAKMSWQAYVDDHLLCDLGEGLRLSSAAILGLDGSVWAQSESFPPIKPEEISAIVNDFNEPGSLAPTGLYLGSTKYMVIQGDAGVVIRGKKGSGGVTVKKTNLALVIGIYEEPVTPGQCNVVVENLGDYLFDQGF